MRACVRACVRVFTFKIRRVSNDKNNGSVFGDTVLWQEPVMKSYSVQCNGLREIALFNLLADKKKPGWMNKWCNGYVIVTTMNVATTCLRDGWTGGVGGGVRGGGGGDNTQNCNKRLRYFRAGNCFPPTIR